MFVLHCVCKYISYILGLLLWWPWVTERYITYKFNRSYFQMHPCHYILCVHYEKNLRFSRNYTPFEHFYFKKLMCYILWSYSEKFTRFKKHKSALAFAQELHIFVAPFFLEQSHHCYFVNFCFNIFYCRWQNYVVALILKQGIRSLLLKIVVKFVDCHIG